MSISCPVGFDAPTAVAMNSFQWDEMTIYLLKVTKLLYHSSEVFLTQIPSGNQTWQCKIPDLNGGF